MLAELDEGLAGLLLARSVEQFLYAEAAMLDERRYRDWLAILDDGIRYFAPLARNMRRDRLGEEYTRQGQDLAWFDEGKETLTQRVEQIETGIHWAEEPVSRVCHMVTNVEILSAVPEARHAETVEVRCRFLVYRNRLQDEEMLLIGKRLDTLVRDGTGWKLRRREIRLDQNVLQAKNLTVFL
ncbi:3-phenylpropionate/cinnamic acid dioxygenase subunit beta [Roseomonas sp. NAR14]|uniref:3-phenylpropionate/cinnamic acid dioxygenase subunit beta n=1 Tax=Roseomonas acroporae TaxID=2937791 RepID=A0A9X2BTP1_9PROT|nr:3-phenylpropionate/cinnamic acid dioxygenase subunit beta [Roseomonas acroporae]MCK8783431.1 3-phenylpropionate/cinnamic acid dioxygenase subunit beta [Roseomonas acroporae]